MKTNLPENFTYTAHTGCVKTADNSLEAIEEGAKHGADIIEFDLNFLPDGTPVLSHDKPKGNEITLDLAGHSLSVYTLMNTRNNESTAADGRVVVKNGSLLNLPKRFKILPGCTVTIEDGGEAKIPSGGAIYYFNPATATNKWIWSRPHILTIGKHRFCS